MRQNSEMTSPLISPEDLLPTLGGAILLDCRPRAAYDEGRLPGAFHVSLKNQLSRAGEEDFDPSRGGRHPLPEAPSFGGQLGLWGIGPDSWVVCYDDQGGANAAARAWWMLRALGHERVQVLDGGLQEIVAAGADLTREEPAIRAVPPYPVTSCRLPTAEIDRVAVLAHNADWKVIDVRAGERYRGETEPLDPAAGHIPGALNLPFTLNLDPRGRFKPKEELRRLYEDFLGGTPANHVVVHCGSGVTACHGLLGLAHAGLGDAVLFVGSWSEWCRSGRTRAMGVERG